MYRLHELKEILTVGAIIGIPFLHLHEGQEVLRSVALGVEAVGGVHF